VEALQGINVGTSGVTSLIMDAQGRVLGRAYQPIGLQTPGEGLFEQDPDEWWRAASATCREALDMARGPDIAAVGLSGQTNAVVPVDSSGRALGPAMIWMDRRAREQARQVRMKVEAGEVARNTGVRIDPFYAYVKMIWASEKWEAFQRCRLSMSSSGFLCQRLCGRAVMDRTQASAAGLVRLQEEKYAVDFLKDIGVPVGKLPPLVAPDETVGQVSSAAAADTGLKAGTPVVAGLCDVASNTLAAGTNRRGDANLKLGTAADLAVCTDRPLPDEQGRTVAYRHALPGSWLAVAGESAGGSVHRWFAEGMYAGENPYASMEKEACGVPPGSDGLVFLPYLTGSRSPFWDPSARGLFAGLTLTHGRKHMARAVLEGLACSLGLRVAVLVKNGIRVGMLSASGGGTRSDLWLQIIADATGRDVQRLTVADIEARGAATIAGMGCGLIHNPVQLAADNCQPERLFRPNPRQEKTYRDLMNRFETLVRQTGKVDGGSK
jgi:xylulokinase